MFDTAKCSCGETVLIYGFRHARIYRKKLKKAQNKISEFTLLGKKSHISWLAKKYFSPKCVLRCIIDNSRKTCEELVSKSPFILKLLRKFHGGWGVENPPPPALSRVKLKLSK